MFGTDPKSLAQTLGAMEKESREVCNFDQLAAKDVFKEYLRRDIRFAPFDASRLVERVMEARSCGRTLDLDDPYLQVNGQKDPSIGDPGKHGEARGDTVHTEGHLTDTEDHAA